MHPGGEQGLERNDRLNSKGYDTRTEDKISRDQQPLTHDVKKRESPRAESARKLHRRKLNDKSAT